MVLVNDVKDGDSERSRNVSVHGKLMRNQDKQDPFEYYKVLSVLGEGSMVRVANTVGRVLTHNSLYQGSVSKVKKKVSARGGSARPVNVKKDEPVCCFPVFNSLLHWTTLKQKQPSFIISSNGSAKTEATDDDMSNLSPSPQQRKSNRHRFLLQESTTSSTTLPELGVSAMSPLSKDEDIVDRTLSSGSMIAYGTKKSMHFALKSLIMERCSKKQLQKELQNEVEILKSLDHPNVVRVFETFFFKKRLFIVLELCNGGDLYTRDPYPEDEAHRIVKSLFRAVAYLHSKGIVHRDLKFENILFVNKSKQAAVRIIDFGLSQKFAKNEHLHAAVGTAYTMAPEQIRGMYGEKIDSWALGVIAFMLLSSSLPFYGRDKLKVMKKILSGHYSFTSKRWASVSDEAKEFVQSLLVRDPELRPSANEALQLPWLQNPRANVVSHTIDQMDDILTSIKAYSSYGTLKKLALMVVSYKSTSEEIGFLRTSFLRFDKSHDGEICFDEFQDAMSESYTYTEEEMRELFNAIDMDETGKVHYMEFLAACIEARGAIDEERLAEAFDRIDADDSGHITIRDLRDFLGNDMPLSVLEKMIDEADADNDRTISYGEFLDLWKDDSVFRSAKEDVSSRRVSSSLYSDLSSELDDEDGTDFFHLHKQMSSRNEKIVDTSSRSEL